MAGISLAPANNALVASPTWERIDEDYNVRSWSVDRGRPNEMSRTDTGTAELEIVDRTGAFDPTNPDGAFFGRLTPGYPMGPLVQAQLELQNPFTEAWGTLFRGFISTIQWTPYIREDHANVTISLVDGLAVLAACEMAPDGSFGHEVLDGNIVYNEDRHTDAVKTRIGKVLDEVGWPGLLRTIFTGNTWLQETRYAPRSPALSVIQDAADAEFPGVANVYMGGPRNPGKLVFHGRYARFDPEGAGYGIVTWQVGDDEAASSDPLCVRASPPLVASIDDSALYTSALSTPQGINDGDIAGQYVTNTGAASRKGLRTWSAENLATFGDSDTTANEMTKLYADYVRDNFNLPRVRVGPLTIKSRGLQSTNSPATWNLLCGVDISDIVHLQTFHGGGGGFDHEFYVEGLHYTARPGGAVVSGSPATAKPLPYIELTLDVSPRGYYDESPFV